MAIIYLVFGIISYLIFFGTFLYAIFFVGNLDQLLPGLAQYNLSTIDNAVNASSPKEAYLINILLLSLFAIQHSLMARQGFKKFWTKIIPPVIERSIYVLLSSLALILLFWQWRTLSAPIWDFRGSTLEIIMWVLFFASWLFVLISTFLISHFELFGLKQVYFNFLNRKLEPPKFSTPLFYKLVRHPIYLGFTIAFWATPYMSNGHLLFAIMVLGYTLVGIFLEEKDLVLTFGEQYQNYKSKVSMIFPNFLKR